MASVLRLSVLLFAAVVLLGAPGKGEAQVPEFDALYIFGDSLADTGNVRIGTTLAGFDPVLPPSDDPHRTYFEGRFANGPIVFEYLWNRLEPVQKKEPVLPSLALTELPSTGAVSFAFGGATTDLVTLTSVNVEVPGLLGQVGLFLTALAGNAPPERALYAILAGGNDYLAAVDPQQVVANIAQAITWLYAAGAREVLVLNLPDLGLAPIVDPANRPLLSALTIAHNTLLAAALEELRAVLPGIHIIAADVYGFVQTLAAASNVTTPAIDALVEPAPGFPAASLCLFVPIEPVGSTCPNVPTFKVNKSYFFWDALHPTTTVHRALAGFVYSELKEAFGSQ